MIIYLKNEGYEVAASLEYNYDTDTDTLPNNGINNIIIRKTSDSLNLPIEYNGLNSEGRAIYKISSDLPNYKNDLPQITKDLLSTPKTKYSGYPKAWFEDFANSNSSADSWINLYYNEKAKSQVDTAIRTGASNQEISDLKKMQQKIRNGISAYGKYIDGQFQTLTK